MLQKKNPVISVLRSSSRTHAAHAYGELKNYILQKPEFWTLPNLIIRAEGLGVSVHVVLGARPSVRERWRRRRSSFLSLAHY